VVLVPDYARRIFHESNVDMPAALKTDSSCDLTLYHQAGGSGKGVLVVTVICSLTFKPTKGAAGRWLTWTQADKTSFMGGMPKACAEVWNEKHRITTTSTVPAVTDVGVIFNVRVSENMSIFSHSHWNLTVSKASNWEESSVHGGGGGFAWNGEATFDSQDNTGYEKATGVTKQRDSVHELGHMLGYRDEYLSTAGAVVDNPAWTTDLHSIMNRGETVRDRHYTMLANWITEQYKPAGHLAGELILFKVNGTLTMGAARL